MTHEEAKRCITHFGGHCLDCEGKPVTILYLLRASPTNSQAYYIKGLCPRNLVSKTTSSAQRDGISWDWVENLTPLPEDVPQRASADGVMVKDRYISADLLFKLVDLLEEIAK